MKRIFGAIDRTSKGAFAELHPRAKRVVAAAFLRRVLNKLPYHGRTVSTDNGGQFTPQVPQFLPGGHRFDRICRACGVAHRLTKPAHPWPNGRVERMDRAIKKAPVKRVHYQPTQELNGHLQAFLLAYNHAKRLKTLRGLTPHAFGCAQWQKNPTVFTRDPNHLTLGLYILAFLILICFPIRHLHKPKRNASSRHCLLNSCTWRPKAWLAARYRPGRGWSGSASA